MGAKVDILKDSLDKELGLEYPCRWEYKIITDSKDKLQNSIAKFFEKREYKFEFSKKSKNGKYDSYVLSLIVFSDEDRKNIFKNLKKDKNIKIII